MENKKYCKINNLEINIRFPIVNKLLKIEIKDSTKISIIDRIK